MAMISRTRRLDVNIVRSKTCSVTVFADGQARRLDNPTEAWESYDRHREAVLFHKGGNVYEIIVNPQLSYRLHTA